MAWLGLDVGGTRMRWAFRPEPAGAAGEDRGVQPAVHGVEATVARLGEVLLRLGQATPGLAAAVAAMAGAGDRALARQIEHGLRGAGVAFPVAVVGDVLAACAAALADGPGVLVWSGTGSFAVARSADGRLHRVGGRGYLLGDDGSAYDLVRRAARAALRAVDGLGPATRLTADLVRALSAPAPERLGAVLQGLDTGQVARHLGVVLAAAAAGDAVAQEVVAGGAGALRELVQAAAARAGLPAGAAAVAMGGGALLGAEPLRRGLVAALAEQGWRAGDLLDDRAAARGAAALAEAMASGRAPLAEWVRHGAV